MTENDSFCKAIINMVSFIANGVERGEVKKLIQSGFVHEEQHLV